MLHQIVDVDIGNQIYLCCFSTNWTVTVNYILKSQHQPRRPNKRISKVRGERDHLRQMSLYIYQQHNTQSSRNGSRAATMIALESKWVPFENLRLLAATSEFCHVLYHGPLPNLSICCFVFEEDDLVKNIYISGLGKEEIPHIEFWMLSYHILVREFF